MARSRALTVVQQTGSSEGKPRNAAAALQQRPDEELDCRDLRHPFKKVGAFYVGREIHRRLVCPRCKTEATDVWKSNGVRIARRYKYPAGYQAKGLRIRPIDVRREVLSRIQVFGSEDEMLSSLFSGGRSRKRA